MGSKQVTLWPGLLARGLSSAAGKRWTELLPLPPSRIYVATWDSENDEYVYAVEETAPPDGRVDDIADIIEVGRGYWVKLDTFTPVLVEDETSVEDEVIIELKRGWNLISNPFERKFRLKPWESSVVSFRRNGVEKSLYDAYKAGWIECGLWGWEYKRTQPTGGNYRLVLTDLVFPHTTSVVDEKAGYWIKVNEPSQMILRLVKDVDVTSSPPRWIFAASILPYIDDLAGDCIYFGASEGLDIVCERPPFPPFAQPPPVTLTVVVDGNEKAVLIYGEWKLEMSWTLKVSWQPLPNTYRRIALIFRGLKNLPTFFDLYLLDEQTGNEISLRSFPQYIFIASPTESERLFVLRAKLAGWVE